MALTPVGDCCTRPSWPMDATAWMAMACAGAVMLACDAPSAPRVSRVAPDLTLTNQLSEEWFAKYDIIDLGTLPDGQDSWATAINARGEVVGWSDIRGGGIASRAFLYDPVRHTMQDLGFIAGRVSIATGINAGGVILVSGDALVLLPLDGRGRYLGLPDGWINTNGGGINSADDIVGQDLHSDGSIRVRVATRPRVSRPHLVAWPE
jgi:probable HAF family extracellular repeat protein